MKNNKGFSLIELIVVIAIMAIISGVAISGLGILSGLHMKECTRKLNTALSKARVNTMGKAEVDAEIEIYKSASDSCYYIKIPGDATDAKLSDSDVKISFCRESARPADAETAAMTEITDSGALKFSYDRSSGAQKKDADGKYIYYISVTQGSKSRLITLVPETGKHTIN